MASVVIVGGGPGGYEAALVAAQAGADVTLVERSGMGGSAVLTDCVPSKALIAVADAARQTVDSADLSVLVNGSRIDRSAVSLDMAAVNERICQLALAQSADIAERLARDGIELISGTARLVGPRRVQVHSAAGDDVAGTAGEHASRHSTGTDGERSLEADVVLIATGARPRILDTAIPDGVRILTWEQVYDLTAVPEHLIVVGSGVTGAEFASAFRGLGSDVTLVSSRDQVLPGQDADAAALLESVFDRRGIRVMSRSRAGAVHRDGDQVRVMLASGQEVVGSHCLMAVGSLPNTAEAGLVETGVRLGAGGFIEVDGMSRTSVPGVYAAGDCTGVLMLASVAAMQGRIAMRHALGEAVSPLDLMTVASNIFTTPEIATVGVTQEDVDAGRINADAVMLPLDTNARAKMANFRDGFVKLFVRSGTRIVVGGVIVAPGARELIHAVTLAVEHRLTADELAEAFTVYPSLSGSVAEAARRLHVRE